MLSLEKDIQLVPLGVTKTLGDHSQSVQCLSAQEVAISASCNEPGARTSNANCLRLYASGGCAS